MNCGRGRLHVSDIHLQVGVHEIYTPPIEQSDWSEFTTTVQVDVYTY